MFILVPLLVLVVMMMVVVVNVAAVAAAVVDVVPIAAPENGMRIFLNISITQICYLLSPFEHEIHNIDIHGCLRFQ